MRACGQLCARTQFCVDANERKKNVYTKNANQSYRRFPFSLDGLNCKHHPSSSMHPEKFNGTAIRVA